MLPTRIYLTGFMGSGKSTVGPLVAEALGYTFLDLDQRIEAQVGTSIARLFLERGAAAFRALETEALRATGLQDGVVVALGGGTLAVEHNMLWALAHGLIIYLHVSPEHLARRLYQEQADRPLLRDDRGALLTEAALRQKVDAMLAQRMSFYRRAHLTVDVGSQAVSETVGELLKVLYTR